MSWEPQEQNYWPGYLDALINVMLNLLFLVAIFAIGLVLLNLESFTRQNQISRLDEQAQQVALHHGFRGKRQQVIDRRAHHQAAGIGEHLFRRQVGLRDGHDARDRGEVFVSLGVGRVQSGDAEREHIMLALEGREERAADVLEREDVLAVAGRGLRHGD